MSFEICKYFYKDSNFQVGCKLFWNFNSRTGSAILMNTVISKSSYTLYMYVSYYFQEFFSTTTCSCLEF